MKSIIPIFVLLWAITLVLRIVDPNYYAGMIFGIMLMATAVMLLEWSRALRENDAQD